MDKVNKTSTAINDERLKQLQALFPEAFVEGKVDFDKLRHTLGENVDSRPERYSFTWAGKREAIQAAQIPSRATLIPDVEQSVNFDETQNIFIEGDNLEVLKLLVRPYFGRVKMIYIDPPYNTGNDFVYPDNYADPLYTYLQMTGQKNGNGDVLTTNTETNGRYHSAWLSMIYPRLQLARQLLSEDGLIFVSIDDNELRNLHMVMDEIFGEENLIAQIVWKKSYGGGAKAKYVVGLHEYILCYARRKATISSINLPPNPETRKYYTQQDDKFDTRGPYRTQPLATTSMDERPNLRYPIMWNSEEIWPEKQWQWSEERTLEALENDELVFNNSDDGKWSVNYKQYLYDEDGNERGAKPYSLLEGPYTQQGTKDLLKLFEDGKTFPFPKPIELIKHLISYTYPNKDVWVLDFFAGSGTTAQAVMDLNREDGGNRRFILVQLPEKTGRKDYPTISAISRERIRRVIQKMQSEKNGKLEGFEQHPGEDLGFRAFRLTETSYRPDPDPEGLSDEEYSKQMALWADSLLVDNWDAMNVIYEVALKEGYGLNIRVEEASVEGNTVYRVTDPDREQSFSICLDDTLRPDIINALGLKKDDLFICHDNALDDTLAANLALQARLQTL